MAKICNNCGASCPDQAAVCFQCHTRFNTTKPSSLPISIPINLKNNKTLQSKYIYVGILFLFILLSIPYIRSNFFPSAPNVKWIKANIPKEILMYSYMSDDYCSTVDNVIIDEEYINDDICIQNCTVDLVDDNFTRTVYLHLETTKMEGNKFYLNSWFETKEETYICTKKLGIERAEDYISSMGFAHSEPNYTFKDNNSKIIATYNADANYTYLSLSGTFKYFSTLKASVEMGEYPHSFRWNFEYIDVSEVKADLKLEGNWTGEFAGYRLDLNIDKEDDKFVWECKAYYDSITGEEKYYSDSGSIIDTNDLSDLSDLSDFDDSTNPEDILDPETAELHLGTINITTDTSCELMFEPESAQIAKSSGLWSYDEYELIKK